MKNLIVSAGDITWGSSRMRCYWPAKYMSHTEVITWDELINSNGIPPADNYIFQKISDPVINKDLLAAGKKVYVDFCDPAWWFSPKESRAIASTVTGVVASSEPLARDFSAWSGMPCKVIPDRLELAHFPLKAEHKETDTVKMVWFGVSVNRYALLNCLDNLNRLEANGHKYELTILDNQPELASFNSNMPIHQVRWSLDAENEILSQHDLALLPPYPGPWGKVKSNNKKLTAWASGLAVTDGMDYETLEILVKSANERKKNAVDGWNTVSNLYNVEQSAKDWQAILDPKREAVFYVGR